MTLFLFFVTEISVKISNLPFFYYDYANPNFIKDMKEEKNQPVELPENAFRELGEGEEYQPVMSPSKNYPEVTLWKVSWGIIMAILFSAAAAYRT